MRNEQVIKRLERIVADEPNNSDALYQLGRLYAEGDDLNSALTYLEKCISVNSSLINARYELGIVFSRNNAYEYAVKEWQKLVDEDGDFRFNDVDSLQAVNLVGAVRAWEKFDAQEADTAYKHFTLGFVFFCLRKLEKSILHYRRAIAMNERFDMAHYFLGLAYADSNDFENAAKVYAIELNLRPQHPNICYHLGVAHYRLGKIQQAITAFQKAIGFRPRYLKAHFLLGVSFFAQTNYPQAEKFLKMAIEYKPSFAEAHLELGNTLQKQYRMDEAEKEYELAVRFNPTLREAILKMGEVKKVQGKMEEALGYFKKASDLGVPDGDVYYQLGSILAQQGKLDEAAREFKRALTASPNDDFAIYALGEVLFSMGETEKAVDVYKRGLLLKPQDTKFTKALGRALFKLGDLDQAICEFHKVLGDNPRDAFSHYYLGLSYFKVGKIDDATKEYQNSVENNPNSAYGHFCLGASYSKTREFDRAITEFEKGAELMPNSEAELALFGTLQLLASIGIEHAQQGRKMEELYINIREVYRETVKALANAIDSRDPYTKFHSARVSRIAKELAMHIRSIDPSLITEEYIEDIEMGGLLHDVGKIGIPDYIVGKPAALSDEEMAVMRRHPIEGVKILQNVRFPWDIIPLVRHHHEKFNGKGYPDGLLEEAIPFGAMIIGICDVYDALVTDRPYRKGFSTEQAMSIIYKLKNVEYAQGLVDAFTEIVPRLEPLLVGITYQRRE